MNLRLSILLVAVLLIFGGTFLVVRLTGSDDSRPQRPWLYRIDDGSIAHITVSYEGSTVDYDRRPGTTDWYIQGEPEIPVFRDLWGGRTLLLSGPKVSLEVAKKLEDPANFGLAPPLTRVLVTDDAGNTIEFHLGDATPDAKNQYVRLVGDSALFTVPISWAEVVNSFVTEPPYLRLFQLDERAIVFIEVNSNGQTAVFTKSQGTGQWSIQGPTPVPVFQDKWGDTVKLISGPRADQIVSETIDDPAQYGLAQPRARVLIGQFGKQPTEFHLGDVMPNGEYQYARVAGEPELYAMPQSQAQRIIDLALEPPYPPDGESATPGPG